MGSNRRTSSFLKECMADALISLMKKGEYSKITINEIADLAGVNRSTWFRNFNDKNDALSYKLVSLWQQWVEKKSLNHEYTLENALDFFSFNYENRELISQIVDAGQGSAVYRAFYEIMLPQYEQDPYVIRFYSFGMFGLLGQWNKRGFKETPREMVEIFYRVMANPPCNSKKDD